MQRKPNALYYFSFVPLVFILSSAFLAHSNYFSFSFFDFFSNIWASILKIFSVQSAPQPTVQQQFASQLSLLKSNTSSFTAFFLSNAPKYNISVNTSWSIQITDKNSSSSTVIGQLTITWIGKQRNLTIQSGIVNASVAPIYSVTIAHKAFMAFSKDALKRDIIGATLDYASYGKNFTYSKIK